jgi:hypothetical protein
MADAPLAAVVRRDREEVSEGLARLLELVAERMPRSEVDQVWAFPGVRRDDREYGVAVITRLAGEGRRLVYRGRYAVILKGEQRGSVEVELEETAETPVELVVEVIEGVRRRADEAGEAEPLDLTAWKAEDGAVGAG